MEGMEISTRRPRQRARSVTSASTPIASPSARAVERLTFKDGLLYVEEIRITPEVPAGGIIDLEIDVTNVANFINPVDDDACTDNLFYGYEYELTVDREWDDLEDTIEHCLTMQDRNVTHSLAFDAPEEPGTYDVDIAMLLPGSDVSGLVSEPVAVVDDDEGDPRPGIPDDGEGGGLALLAAAGGLGLVLVALAFQDED